MSEKNSWDRVCIKDVCESIIDCVNKTATTVNEPTPYKMIRTTNVKSGWINLSEVKYVTEEIYRKWTRRGVPKKGDVILTREAPLGEVGMLRDNDTIFLGQRLVQYRADPTKLDNRFLLYSFQADDLQGQIKSFGSGATVEHMRVPDAEKLTIIFPSLTTQRKIAAILSAYDDIIENNTRRIKILEEMAQALYREWFVKFRFPGHEKVKMVESEIGVMPEGWEVKKLEEVCLRITDGSHWSPKTVDDGYPMASVKDMNQWGFDISQCRKIAKEDYEELIRNDCKPLKGDVLIAKDGSYLKHIFVTEKELELVILSSIAIIRPNNQILPHVLSLY
ncbi:MAG: restriction endonuclease subunit S, partial [Candidatus Methanoperedens sp.]